MFLSLSLDQLPTHYYLHFHCCGVSLRFPFMWSFCWCYFLWDIFTLFITTTLHIYITRFAFICSSHGIQESLKEWHHQYFHGQLFLLWLHLSLSFMSNIIIFFFLLHFYFSWAAPPCDHHMGLSVGHEAEWLHALLPVCVNWVTNVQGPVTNRFWEKWCSWSPISISLCHLPRDL